MAKFAANTDVPSDRSRAEIEKILQRYGAGKFMYGWDQNSAVIAFEMNERRIQFQLPLPDRESNEIKRTPSGNLRTSKTQIDAAYEQAVRQRWRALALVIKAKMEAVEVGITMFEDEFLAHIVLPDGQTVGRWMAPQVAHAYQTGKMPPLLPSPGCESN